MQGNGKSALKRVGSLVDVELGQSTTDSQREASDDEDDDEDEHEDDGVAPLQHVLTCP
jgi:Ran GTPase-activating protein (RanGAP) involved in mRNA processing and transport